MAHLSSSSEIHVDRSGAAAGSSRKDARHTGHTLVLLSPSWLPSAAALALTTACVLFESIEAEELASGDLTPDAA